MDLIDFRDVAAKSKSTFLSLRYYHYLIMSKRSATDVDTNDGDGRSKRTKADEEKVDGAETGSEPHLSSSSSSEAVNSLSSRQLMSLLFNTLDQKNVDHFREVNALMAGLFEQSKKESVSKPPPFTHWSQLMDWLFATSEEKGVNEDVNEGVDKSAVRFVGEVNILLIQLLHQEDERETTKEIGEAAVCVICEEHEPNAKILPCGHSASCSVCTQKVIDVGSGKCPFCRKEVSGEEKRKFWDIRELTLCFVAD